MHASGVLPSPFLPHRPSPPRSSPGMRPILEIKAYLGGLPSWFPLTHTNALARVPHPPHSSPLPPPPHTHTHVSHLIPPRPSALPPPSPVPRSHSAGAGGGGVPQQQRDGGLLRLPREGQRGERAGRRLLGLPVLHRDAHALQQGRRCVCVFVWGGGHVCE